MQSCRGKLVSRFCTRAARSWCLPRWRPPAYPTSRSRGRGDTWWGWKPGDQSEVSVRQGSAACIYYLEEDHPHGGRHQHRHGGAHHLAPRLNASPLAQAPVRVPDLVHSGPRLYIDLLAQLAVPLDDLLPDPVVVHEVAGHRLPVLALHGGQGRDGEVLTRGQGHHTPLPSPETLLPVVAVHGLTVSDTELTNQASVFAGFNQSELSIYLNADLEPHHAGLWELEGLECSLEVLRPVKLCESWEDQGIRGAASLVQKLDAVHIVAADGPEVPGKNPEQRPLLHLDPEEELLPEPSAADEPIRGQ